MVAIPAVLFAGISKAGFGSGASFAAAPILALILEPEVALGLLLPLFMLIDASALRPYWKQWHGPSALAICVGGIPGVLLGVALFSNAPADTLRILIGAIAILFVVYELFRVTGTLKIAAQPFRPVLGAFTGLVAGFTSFVSHAGGPPVAMFLLSQSMGKTTYQATTVIVFWAINIMKAVPYGFLGVFTWQTLLADLYLTPFAMLGTWLGVTAHRLIPERLFFGFTYVLLLITGTKLVVDAFT